MLLNVYHILLQGSQHTQVDTDKSIEETDKTLVDIIPDSKTSDSK